MNGFVLLANGASPTQNLSIFDPASPPAESIRSLFILILAITGGIFVVVEGLLLVCIFRFRKRDTSLDTEPPQVYGSNPIEIAWTILPLLIVFVLFLIVIRYVGDIKAAPRRPPAGGRPLYVTVVGHQWWWEYRLYDNQEDQQNDRNGVRIANELHVPVSDDPRVRRPVYLKLESVDVIHSFWVPRLAGKTDVIPNRGNIMWFEAREKGLFLGQCAEYCGTQHAGMLIRVIADTVEEFQDWLRGQREPANENLSDPERAGKAAFLGQGCVNCHAVRGTPARGTFGPDLTHLRSRETLVTGLVRNDRKNLTEWVRDPQKSPDGKRGIKPGCLMPNMHLRDERVELIVGYLEALK
jgi:cytochrome c oxidase subunit 2